MIVVALDDLRRFARDAFAAMGLAPEPAALSAHALIYSELRFHPGQGQGVRRLPAYADRIAAGTIDPAAPFEILKETPALALVDGHRAPGSVTGIRAMRLAAAKAKISGIGHVVVRNGTHYGSSAVHVHEAVLADCLGIAVTNAGAEMAPWGGAEARVGTNPWAIGAPTDRGFPIILDIALTTAGKGMMRWLAREGRPMPRDWALTPEGDETDDPAAAMAGALLGIGEHKGYGLSMMTDVMTGVLSGGGFGLAPYSDAARQDVSHAFTAIDIGWFMPVADFRARVGRFVDEAKSARLRPGFAEILAPGELEHRRAAEKTANGVPLDRAVHDELAALAARLGIAFALSGRA